MSIDVQNIYMTNFYMRNTLMLLYVILLSLSLILMIEQKRKNIIIKKLKHNNVYQFVALYYCTILPVNFICVNEHIDNKLFRTLILLNHYSFIIALSLIVGFLSYICLLKNKYTILNAAKKPFILVLYIFTLLEAIHSQIIFFNWYNNINIFLLVVFSSMIYKTVIIKEHKTETLIQKDVNLDFEPIKLNSELYKERIWQKNRLIKIIEKNMYIKTICVSAEWGQGKTSFINIVESELRSKKYPIIRINALDFRSLATLFNYYFEQLEIIIREYGYYKGLASEFSNFTKTLANIILDYNKINFSINKTNDYSYIVEKQNLQGILNEALGDKRLIVIVDDVERCDSELSLQYIKFIKEIAAFDKCVILFLSDYEELLKLPNVSEKYIQKFINYRFDLNIINFREILNYVCTCNPGINEFIGNINLDITNEIDKILYRQISEIEKLKSERKELDNNKDKYKIISNDINEKILKFYTLEHSLSNPRTIYRLCESIIEMKNTINDYLEYEKLENDFMFFFNNIKITQSIVAICLIQTLYPIEYEKIKKSSLNNYIENISEELEQLVKNSNYEKKFTLEEKIIIDICNELWFKIPLFLSRSYNQCNSVVFIDKLIFQPSTLNESVKPFISEIDENISFIKNKRWDDIDRTYIDLVNLILSKYKFANFSEGAILLKDVFEHYIIMEEKENGNINKCFNVFSYSMEVNKWINPEIAPLKNYYLVINKRSYNLTESKTHSERLLRFSRLYVLNSIGIINRALRYNIIKFSPDNIDLEKLISIIFNENTYELMIKKYTSLLTNEKKSSFEENINLLICLIDETNRYINKHCFDYKDVNMHIIKAKKLLEEYQYLNLINNYVSEKNIEEEIFVADFVDLKVDIEGYIKYFNNNNDLNYEEEELKINDFTNKLFEEDNSKKINMEILKLYNEVLSVYSEKFQEDISEFRIKSLRMMEKLTNNTAD